MYITAIKDSYDFMQGLRGPCFWLSLPIVALKITYWQSKEMCGPDCEKKGHKKSLTNSIKQ